MDRSIEIIRIKTTSLALEDFLLRTNLSNEEITSVILPLKKAEAAGGKFNDNDDYVKALQEAYPDYIAEAFGEIEELVI